MLLLSQRPRRPIHSPEFVDDCPGDARPRIAVKRCAFFWIEGVDCPQKCDQSAGHEIIQVSAGLRSPNLSCCQILHHRRIRHDDAVARGRIPARAPRLEEPRDGFTVVGDRLSHLSVHTQSPPVHAWIGLGCLGRIGAAGPTPPPRIPVFRGSRSTAEGSSHRASAAGGRTRPETTFCSPASRVGGISRAFPEAG